MSASRSAAGSRGGTSTPDDAVLDRIPQAADSRRDDRTAVGHRLSGGHAVALAPRRDADDRRPARSTSRARTAARSRARLGARARSGPSPTITRGSPSVASTNSRIPFSSDSRPANSTVRRLSRLADRLGDLDPGGNDPHLRRAELGRRVGQERWTPRARTVLRGAAGGPPRAPASRARRPSPTPAARTACRSRAPRARTESSARAPGRRHARRDAPRARTPRRRPAPTPASTARPEDSGRCPAP